MAYVYLGASLSSCCDLLLFLQLGCLFGQIGCLFRTLVVQARGYWYMFAPGTGIRRGPGTGTGHGYVVP